MLAASRLRELFISFVMIRFASSFATAKKTVDTIDASAANESRSERSVAAPGFAAAYATPPTIGANVRLTHHGAILPVNASATSVPMSGSVALITVVKYTEPAPIAATCSACPPACSAAIGANLRSTAPSIAGVTPNNEQAEPFEVELVFPIPAEDPFVAYRGVAAVAVDLLDQRIGEFLGTHFRGAFHVAGEIVGHDALGHDLFECPLDHPADFRPADVVEHHHAGEQQRGHQAPHGQYCAGPIHIYVAELDRGASGRREDAHVLPSGDSELGKHKGLVGSGQLQAVQARCSFLDPRNEARNVRFGVHLPDCRVEVVGNAHCAIGAQRSDTAHGTTTAWLPSIQLNRQIAWECPSDCAETGVNIGSAQ